MKHKTLATWLALIGGPLGAHRHYLHGFNDGWAWTYRICAVIGLWGLWRMQHMGLDDHLGIISVSVWSVSFAASALTAIIYGLTSAERWNARFNDAQTDHPAGRTTGWTVAAVVLALAAGATALLSALALALQTYFS